MPLEWGLHSRDRKLITRGRPWQHSPNTFGVHAKFFVFAIRVIRVVINNNRHIVVRGWFATIPSRLVGGRCGRGSVFEVIISGLR